MHQRLHYLILAVTLFLLVMIQACNQVADNQDSGERLPEKISYNFHIRPIFSDKCFACHGPDANKREAGLRLDIAEAAYQALEENPSAHALVPNKPNASEVFLRISSTDEEQMMPPPESELKLTNREIKLIEKWIKQGAKYEPHWAFAAPEEQEIPPIENEEWVKNDIDYFVLHKQEEEGISPNEEADKERLLKRVSFDLTGLPPNDVAGGSVRAPFSFVLPC